jgi:hypothetical protein
MSGAEFELSFLLFRGSRDTGSSRWSLKPGTDDIGRSLDQRAMQIRQSLGCITLVPILADARIGWFGKIVLQSTDIGRTTERR